MSQTAAPSPIGWFADPTHRHEYRYYDGTVWTELVADHGATTHDPLEPAPTAHAAVSPDTEAARASASTPAALAPEGRFATRWLDLYKVVMPRVCCACGEPGAFDELKVGGSDWTGKLSATVNVPLCDRCAAVLLACGVKPGHAPGGLLGARRVPAELKPKYKHIVKSASCSLKRMGLGGIGIRFTFTNAAFAQAFEAANPKRKR